MLKKAVERFEQLLLDVDSDQQEVAAVSSVLARNALHRGAMELAVVAIEWSAVFRWMSRLDPARERRDNEARLRRRLVQIWQSFRPPESWFRIDSTINVSIESELMALIDELRVVRRASPLCEHHLVLVDVDRCMAVLDGGYGPLQDESVSPDSVAKLQRHFQRAMLAWLAKPERSHLEEMDKQLQRLGALDRRCVGFSLLGRSLLEQLRLRLPAVELTSKPSDKREQFPGLVETGLHLFDAEFRRQVGASSASTWVMPRRLVRRIVAIVARARTSVKSSAASSAVTEAFLVGAGLAGGTAGSDDHQASKIARSEARLSKRQWARGKSGRETLEQLRDSMLLLGQVEQWQSLVLAMADEATFHQHQLDSLFPDPLPTQPNRDVGSAPYVKTVLESAVARHLGEAVDFTVSNRLSDADLPQQLLQILDQLLPTIRATIQPSRAATRRGANGPVIVEVVAEAFGYRAAVSYRGEPLPHPLLVRIRSLLANGGGVLQTRSKPLGESGYWSQEIRLILRHPVRSMRLLPVRSGGVEFALLARRLRVRSLGVSNGDPLVLAALLELEADAQTSPFAQTAVWDMPEREHSLCIECKADSAHEWVVVDAVAAPVEELVWSLEMPFVRSSYLAGVVARHDALVPVIDLSALLQLEARG